MTWAYRDESDRLGFPAAPIAVGLACVVLVAAVVYVTRRHHDTTPAGVVNVPAGTGTFAPGDRPPTAQVIAGLAYGPDPVQRIDLYRPPGARGRLPVMVYLHSGGWLSGGRDQVPDFLLQEVTRANIEVASVGYRLSGAHGVNPFPAAPSDVDRALRWLTANSAFLALDPTRVVLSGTSAGGHLAALTAAAPGAFTDPVLPAALLKATPHVVGVIDAVGPSDLLSMGREPGIAAGMVTSFLACSSTNVASCDAAKLRAASVTTHLTASAPPAFLVYGRKDTLVPPSTQGTPLARDWARARGDDTRAPAERGVWYEIADDGHNVSQATINMDALQRWLAAVLSGHLR
ncbi:MAG TPA: alpha/beta hydrolase [Acidimicrobiales bacterium]|nr:alpha/beta hydrolase [Acidimicrobiales bacterium]